MAFQGGSRTEKRGIASVITVRQAFTTPFFGENGKTWGKKREEKVREWVQGFVDSQTKKKTPPAICGKTPESL